MSAPKNRRHLRKALVQRMEVASQIRGLRRPSPGFAPPEESAYSDDVADLLRMTLGAAVPMWIERLRMVPFDEVQRVAQEAAEVIAEKGDVLQFGGKGCKDAFNALARGLACCAFSPGGVRFLGEHWESVP